MFEDKRSKKVLLVAHCILNQNAKIDGCAYYPGMFTKVVEALLASGVGLIQMPCPELMILGLDRQVDPGVQNSVEFEDTRVWRRMSEETAIATCRGLAQNLVYQIDQYRHNGFAVLGLLGINGSPTCGVETNWTEAGEEAAPGVFIQVLKGMCEGKNILLQMRGIKTSQFEAALDAVRDLIRLKNGN